MLKIFGDQTSGNCLKVLYAARYLGQEFAWVEVDVTAGESRTATSLSRNPAGQVPYVEVSPGRYLSQSNAILLYLAEGSALLPADRWLAAKVHQWLFWEQYSHEPYIAVCRSEMRYRGKRAEELDPIKVEKGNAALDLMEDHLAGVDWLVGAAMSVADIALVAYTRLAHEGGFTLETRPRLRSWIARVEEGLNVAPP